jgi:hypothetical protein
MLGLVFCLVISHTFAQSSSKSFKPIKALYEVQVNQFFVDVFELQKTGATIENTMKEELEAKIFEAFLLDFNKWKEFAIKHKGEKKFEFKLKEMKDFEAEGKEYTNQFKNFQKDFVANRMLWSESELKNILTKEELQKFIDPVMKKFEDRTKKLIQKLTKT